MVVAAQKAVPALPGPVAPDRVRRGPLLLTGPTDAPSWAALGAMFGREAPRALPSSAETSADDEPIEEAELRPSIVEGDRVAGDDLLAHDEPAPEMIWSEVDSAAIEAAPSPTDTPDEPAGDTEERLGESLDEPAFEAEKLSETDQAKPQSSQSRNPLSYFLGAFESLHEPSVTFQTGSKEDDPEMSSQLYGDVASLDQDDDTSLGWLTPLSEHRAVDEPPAPSWATLVETARRADPGAGHTPPAPSEEAPVDEQRIAGWLALLQNDDPALFKLWSMELVAQPKSLPTILSALTDDVAIIHRSDEPRYQCALVAALAAQTKPTLQRTDVQPDQPKLDDGPAPDWLNLRRGGQEEMRDD
jgi:hypothetical protein